MQNFVKLSSYLQQVPNVVLLETQYLNRQAHDCDFNNTYCRSFKNFAVYKLEKTFHVVNNLPR